MTLLRICAAIAVLALPHSTTAQSKSEQFSFTSNTGNNATVVLLAESRPAVGDDLLSSGDEIGVFTESGDCVGAIIWQDRNQAITIWGDNSATEDVDGILYGDRFYFRVWRATDGRLFRYVEVTIQEDDETVYRTDGIYIVTSFKALEKLPPPVIVSPVDGASHGDFEITLQWGTPFPVSAFDVELATDLSFGDVVYTIEGLTEPTLKIDALEPGKTYYWRIRAHDEFGKSEWSEESRFETAVNLDAGDESSLPFSLQLHQNYPNPFNPVTVVPFDTHRAGYTSVQIFDLTGRHVETLLDRFLEPGFHRVEWHAGNHASGQYLIVLRTDDTVLSRKTLFLK